MKKLNWIDQINLCIWLIILLVFGIGGYIWYNESEDNNNCEKLGGVYLAREQICIDKKTLIDFK